MVDPTFELDAGPCSMAGESGPDRRELRPQLNPEPAEPPGNKDEGEVIAVTGGRIAFGEFDANDCSKGFGSWSSREL